MKAIPSRKQIIVVEEKAKPGVIELATASKERPQIGVVQSVGKDIKDYSPADRVCFTRFNIHEVEFEGETLYIMTEDQILFGVTD